MAWVGGGRCPQTSMVCSGLLGRGSHPTRPRQDPKKSRSTLSCRNVQMFKCSIVSGASTANKATRAKSKPFRHQTDCTTCWTTTLENFRPFASWMTKWSRWSTGTSRTKIPCKSTSTSLWLVSPLVGPDSNSTKKGWVSSIPSKCCTSTPIPSSSLSDLGILRYLPAIISANLPANWNHIVEFASAGPKNYGYRTKDGKVECKVRGFTLNARGQSQLNFDLLKANVPLDEPWVIPVHNPHKAAILLRPKPTPFTTHQNEHNHEDHRLSEKDVSIS